MHENLALFIVELTDRLFILIFIFSLICWLTLLVFVVEQQKQKLKESGKSFKLLTLNFFVFSIQSFFVFYVGQQIGMYATLKSNQTFYITPWYEFFFNPYVLDPMLKNFENNFFS